MANAKPKVFGHRGKGRVRTADVCIDCLTPIKRVYIGKKGGRGHCRCKRCRSISQTTTKISMEKLLNGQPHVVDFSAAPINVLAGWHPNALQRIAAEWRRLNRKKSA